MVYPRIGREFDDDWSLELEALIDKLNQDFIVVINQIWVKIVEAADMKRDFQLEES